MNTAPADALPAIQRAGSTLYALNTRGENLWSAQVQPGRTDDDKRLPDAECERIAAILADRARSAGDGWMPIETAPIDELVAVFWLDPKDDEHPERHSLDFIEEGVWHDHYSYWEQVQIVGGWGVKETPPYTHWKRLGAPGAAPATPPQAAKDELRQITAAALEELRLVGADAARYRWLRDTGDATWRPFGIRAGYSAEKADAAIDAARATQQGDAQ